VSDRTVVATSDYWQRALQGERPPVEADKPEPGFYKRKLVKNGPWVGCRIWIEEERDEDGNLISDVAYHCEVDGKPADAFAQWLWLASHPITESEYRFMVDDAAWCRAHAPDDPKANPARPINPSEVKPVLPPAQQRSA
jgi:hypothetical protein